MPEMHRAVVAQLDIIGVGVDRNGLPINSGQRAFVRQKLTAVYQHPLTPLTMSGDATILGAGDETIAQGKAAALRRQQDAATLAAALNFDIRQGKPAQIVKPAEIQNVFEPLEGEHLCAIRVI